MSYIAFLDLLGIKSIAAFDDKLYFNNIKKFQQTIEMCKAAFKNCKYEIRAFSDCAYIECEEIVPLFDYLQKLRNTLFLDEIFFNAAVTCGKLGCAPVKNHQHIICVSFHSSETVKVYSMQNSFSGVGIYVDPNLIENLDKKIIEQYLIKSSYCVYDTKEIYNNFESYYDVKYNKITLNLLKYILMNYLKTIALNKKAARYYLSAISTCINQISYEDLTANYFSLFLNSDVLTKNHVLFADLLPVYLMIINRLYDSYREFDKNDDSNVNHSIDEFLEKILEKSPLKNGFDNLQFYSDKLISNLNKYYLTDYVSKSIVSKL